MHKTSKIGLAAIAGTATLALSVGTAAAAGSAAPKATGSVVLSSTGYPLQYASFNAFDYGAPANDRGSVTYSNFTYPDPGSGVWNLAATVPIDFNIGGGDYFHLMTVTSETVTGARSLAFTATGVYSDPSYTWNATGTVNGSDVVIDLVYTGANAGYALHLAGTIASDGSISGSETGSNSGTFTSPAGSASEVLSYTASVTNVVVSGADASFDYVIPAGHSLSNVPVTITMHDGGSSGAGNDTFTVNGDNDPVVAGNLTVH